MRLLIAALACLISVLTLGLTSVASLAQTSSCLDILPNPDAGNPSFSEFDRYINVLGTIKFYAEPGVSDAKLIHAASIGAELLDNDEDGLIDDVELGEQLSLVNSIMPLFLEEGSPAEEAMMENFDETFCVHAVLYSEEIAPEAPLDWFSEASLEEILHTINGCGHVELYPSMFALWPAGASQLTQAMDLARGGQFLGIPSTYPEEAWFHYYDVTCDYECMAFEYLYWAIATNMGVLDTPDICEAIEEEWELCSPELLETTDSMVYGIITNPNNKLPQLAPNGIYCPTNDVSGCSDPEACNYDSTSIIDDGSCEFTSCLGCTTPVACNYDPEATIDDGSCEFICEGCTDSVACNYDPSANVDDSSCEYLSCAGCTDDTACNFNPESTINDGSCLYPEQYYDCLGVCINDIDSDGICDELEILGCTDQGSCNFNVESIIDDGSCIYPEQYYDCFGGCINDIDSDGICDELEIPGCTDEGSCNFNLQATDDDGSCEYITCAGCQYEFACNYDPDATIADNESCEYGTCPGCTDSTACNYNPTVFEDDESCFYPGAPCDDENAYTYGDIIQPSCECVGYSCSYSEACNYNPLSGMAYNGDVLVIPDALGVTVASELFIDSFEQGQVLENCADLLITANIEHSFIGDLSFWITCPDGTEVILMDNGASGGPDPTGCTPIDLGGNDLGIVDVEGWDYLWNMDAEWVLDDANNPDAGNPMPSGTYLPCEDLCDFVGCPLNGIWTFNVIDQWAGDNGTLFGWGINFDGFVIDPNNGWEGASIYINNNYCSYIGSPCNDGNEVTVNDTYTEDCECIGDCQYDIDNDGICDISCSNDLDNDGVTTVQDLLLVLYEFGCYENCDNDANGDGVVNIQDLLSILSVFGTFCE